MRYRYTFVICVSIVMLLTAFTSAAQTDCPTATTCPEIAMASFGLSAAEIAAYSAPAVQQLEVRDEILYDRHYQRINTGVEIFDAPNGNQIGTLDQGFNFVTTARPENGWAQINPNQWIRSDNLGDANVSSFSGVTFDEPLPFPMAWVLVTSRTSRVPGVEASDSDPLLLRYDRVYLYSTVEVNGWNWYQVGPDQWIQQTLVSQVLPVKRPAEVDTHRWISVDLYEQVAIAYEGETPVFATLVSSGLPEWATNEGLFHIYVHYSRTRMSGAEGAPDFYYLEEVPWTMYFDNDIGLHGTYWHDGFGYRRSHGCVNMSITDSHWVYNWAVEEYNEEENAGAAVYVYSSGEYR